MMKKALPIVIILIGITAFGFFIYRGAGKLPSVASDTSQSRFGSVPDLVLEDYEGKNVSLTSLRGKPIIVNAWSTWCPFCINELPDFAQLQAELGDQVTIIAIDRSESLAQAKQYTDDLQITDGLVFLLDPEDSFYKAIGGFSMPETIFVDAEGVIRQHKRGFMRLEEMRGLSKSIL